MKNTLLEEVRKYELRARAEGRFDDADYWRQIGDVYESDVAFSACMVPLHGLKDYWPGRRSPEGWVE